MSFPDYGRNFLNIHWSLLGMLSKLPFTCSQEHFVKGYFFRFLQNCFRALNDNPPDLWRKVSAASRKLHSTCRKNFSIFWQNFVMFHLTSCSSEKKLSFWKRSFVSFVKVAFWTSENFLRKSIQKNDFFSNLICIFSQNYTNFGEIFQQNRQHAFYVCRGTLLQKHYVDFVKQFPTLGKELSDLLRKLCSLVSKTAFLSPDEQFEEEFWRKFYFFWFFSDVQGTFFGFFGVSLEAWWSKLNSTSQDEHIHQEKIGEKNFYPFRTMSAFFWTFIEVF